MIRMVDPFFLIKTYVLEISQELTFAIHLFLMLTNSPETSKVIKIVNN